MVQTQLARRHVGYKTCISAVLHAQAAMQRPLMMLLAASTFHHVGVPFPRRWSKGFCSPEVYWRPFPVIL